MSLIIDFPLVAFSDLLILLNLSWKHLFSDKSWDDFDEHISVKLLSDVSSLDSTAVAAVCNNPVQLPPSLSSGLDKATSTVSSRLSASLCQDIADHFPCLEGAGGTICTWYVRSTVMNDDGSCREGHAVAVRHHLLVVLSASESCRERERKQQQQQQQQQQQHSRTSGRSQRWCCMQREKILFTTQPVVETFISPRC